MNEWKPIGHVCCFHGFSLLFTLHEEHKIDFYNVTTCHPYTDSIFVTSPQIMIQFGTGIYVKNDVIFHRA